VSPSPTSSPTFSLRQALAAFTPQLIVSDLDGTLVPKSLNMHPRVVQAVAQLGQQQPPIPFVVATGRMYPSALPYAQQLGLNTPLIAYQGALVKEPSGKVLYQQFIPFAIAEELLAFASQRGFHLNLYLNDILHTPAHPVYVDEYQRTSSIEPVIVENPLATLRALNVSPPKLVMIDNHPEHLEAMRQHLQSQFGPDVLAWCQSRHNFLEITAAGVNKWRAVQVLLEHWNLEPQHVLALGDEENDLSMLTQAGLGVATANAPAAIAAQVPLVTASVDDGGSADALAYFALSNVDRVWPEVFALNPAMAPSFLRQASPC
jgi:Cof subfamily protein (haloacid dehalogenase superfamily)